MRLLRTGLRVLAVALVAVASGVAVNQVLNDGQWNVRWLAAAVRTWPRSTHSTGPAAPASPARSAGGASFTGGRSAPR